MKIVWNSPSAHNPREWAVYKKRKSWNNCNIYVSFYTDVIHVWHCVLKIKTWRLFSLFCYCHVLIDFIIKNIWAASWQNQQSDCAPSEDRSAWASAPSAQADQSLRYALNGYLRTEAFFMRTAKTLIRLGGCTVILLVLTCSGSFFYTSWWCQRRAKIFDCGTPWRQFHFNIPFVLRHYGGPKHCTHLYH